MKIFIYSALAATLCVAPAMAQTETGIVPRPMAPRPADVAGQIQQDLNELANSLGQNINVFSAFPYVYGARIGYFGASEWTKELRRLLQYGTIQIDSVKILERNGNDARATVTYKIVPNDNFDAKTRDFWSASHQETLDFKLGTKLYEPKVSVWEIVPLQVAPPAIETSESVANQNILLANVAYYIAQKQSPSPIGTSAERSMNNLKQLGLGVLQFTQDYDEIYAFEPRYLIEAITPYVVSPAVFQVPDTNEIYTFNSSLSGLNLAKVNEVYKTVLFYEGQNEKPIFRYDGKAAICFADGHVALVTPDQAKSLIWKP